MESTDSPKIVNVDVTRDEILRGTGKIVPDDDLVRVFLKVYYGKEKEKVSRDVYYPLRLRQLVKCWDIEQSILYPAGRGLRVLSKPSIWRERYYSLYIQFFGLMTFMSYVFGELVSYEDVKNKLIYSKRESTGDYVNSWHMIEAMKVMEQETRIRIDKELEELEVDDTGKENKSISSYSSSGITSNNIITRDTTRKQFVQLLKQHDIKRFNLFRSIILITEPFADSKLLDHPFLGKLGEVDVKVWTNQELQVIISILDDEYTKRMVLPITGVDLTVYDLTKDLKTVTKAKNRTSEKSKKSVKVQEKSIPNPQSNPKSKSSPTLLPNPKSTKKSRSSSVDILPITISPVDEIPIPDPDMDEIPSIPSLSTSSFMDYNQDDNVSVITLFSRFIMNKSIGSSFSRLRSEIIRIVTLEEGFTGFDYHFLIKGLFPVLMVDEDELKKKQKERYTDSSFSAYTTDLFKLLYILDHEGIIFMKILYDYTSQYVSNDTTTQESSPLLIAGNNKYRLWLYDGVHDMDLRLMKITNTVDEVYSTLFISNCYVDEKGKGTIPPIYDLVNDNIIYPIVIHDLWDFGVTALKLQLDIWRYENRIYLPSYYATYRGRIASPISMHDSIQIRLLLEDVNSQLKQLISASSGSIIYDTMFHKLIDNLMKDHFYIIPYQLIGNDKDKNSYSLTLSNNKDLFSSRITTQMIMRLDEFLKGSVASFDLDQLFLHTLNSFTHRLTYQSDYTQHLIGMFKDGGYYPSSTHLANKSTILGVSNDQSRNDKSNLASLLKRKEQVVPNQSNSSSLLQQEPVYVTNLKLLTCLLDYRDYFIPIHDLQSRTITSYKVGIHYHLLYHSFFDDIQRSCTDIIDQKSSTTQGYTDIANIWNYTLHQVRKDVYDDYVDPSIHSTSNTYESSYKQLLFRYIDYTSNPDGLKLSEIEDIGLKPLPFIEPEFIARHVESNFSVFREVKTTSTPHGFVFENISSYPDLSYRFPINELYMFISHKLLVKPSFHESNHVVQVLDVKDPLSTSFKQYSIIVEKDLRPVMIENQIHRSIPPLCKYTVKLYGSLDINLPETMNYVLHSLQLPFSFGDKESDSLILHDKEEGKVGEEGIDIIPTLSQNDFLLTGEPPKPMRDDVYHDFRILSSFPIQDHTDTSKGVIYVWKLGYVDPDAINMDISLGKERYFDDRVYHKMMNQSVKHTSYFSY